MSPSSSISSNPPPHLRHVDTNKSSAASSSRPPRPPAGSSSGSGPQNQACAACKYQRRKCNPDCPLAPYFPADQQRRFLNAHRLFGVSNIQKTLRRIDPEHGPVAMQALIYQSEARAADPVYGCVGIIKELEHRIHLGTAQLQALRHQIAIYRQAAAAPLAGPAMMVPTAAPGQDNVVMTMDDDALYGQEEAPAQAGAGFAVVHDQQQARYNAAALKVDDQDQQPAQIPLYDYFCFDDGTAGDEATSHDATVHNEYCYSDAGVKQTTGSPTVMMTTLGEQLDQHCQIEAAPLVGAFDEKPQDDLPMMVMEHHSHGGGGVVEQPKEKVAAAAVIMRYDADQKMAEPAPAAAAQRCHLELGFSSF